MRFAVFYRKREGDVVPNGISWDAGTLARRWLVIVKVGKRAVRLSSIRTAPIWRSLRLDWQKPETLAGLTFDICDLTLSRRGRRIALDSLEALLESPEGSEFHLRAVGEILIVKRLEEPAVVQRFSSRAGMSLCKRIDHMHTLALGCWEMRPEEERRKEFADNLPDQLKAKPE